MADRTFGWVQEAYTLPNLKNVVKLFVLDSDINKLLRDNKIPRLISEDYGKNEMLKYLSVKDMRIPYTLLKGKGTPSGYTRSNAPCSGIVQAVLPGQRKEYQSDWPADSFLRWAISIGLLNYDRDDDCVYISDAGRKYALSDDDSDEEYEVLTEALFSNPPVCRIMQLLESGELLSKFEIGAQLGFLGEAGFTSIPLDLILQGLDVAKDREERNKLLSDTEGTSDKYVRTVCAWLKSMGWISQIPKSVTVDLGYKTYTDTIPQSYRITLKGKNECKHLYGISKFKKFDKIVPWEMLATKTTDRDYVRTRRAFEISYLSSATFKKPSDVVAFLKTKGIDEDELVVLDDIRGFDNIGLSVISNSGSYRINDTIVGLEVPSAATTTTHKSNLTIVKDNVRKQLVTVDHKYLALIDLSFDGTADRDFEIQTAELLTKELNFKGARLGDSRKPDVCIFYDKNGLIIDNKAYSKGYSLPIKQADEMYRYIEENKTRNKAINPNEWWNIFPSTVTEYNFAFCSGEFSGGFKDRLDNIYMRSGIMGAAISSVNLLLIAEKLKSGALAYTDVFKMFDCNDEIII